MRWELGERRGMDGVKRLHWYEARGCLQAMSLGQGDLPLPWAAFWERKEEREREKERRKRKSERRGGKEKREIGGLAHLWHAPLPGKTTTSIGLLSIYIAAAFSSL